MRSKNQYQRVVSFILFILALILLYKLIQPLIVILLSSVLLVYVSFPIYKRIHKKISNESFSILLSLLTIVIIILIPFTFLTFGIAQQGYYFYNSLSSNIDKGALFGFGCSSTSSQVCLILNQIEEVSLEQFSKFGIDIQIQAFLLVLEKKISEFILQIPIVIAKLFLILTISYFIMRDWENILHKITNLLPMRKKTVKKLITEFENTAHTVIYAQLIVAIIQGIIASLGFYLFGVPFPLILGIMVAFAALIPVVGTALIWAPASLFLVLSGYFSNDYVILAKGIGLFFYCLLIISTIDNILLAKIVSVKSKVNPISTILGVIGGASLFGIIGIFIGPILLPLLITYFETFKERFD